MSSHVQVFFTKRMLAMLAALLVAPWLVFGGLWAGLRVKQAVSASPPPAGSQKVSEEVLLGRPGPWGQLEYVPMSLSLPDEFVFVPPANQPPVRWFFHGFSKDQVVEFLRTAGLPAQPLQALLDKGKWTPSPEGMAVEPGDKLILGLTPDVRGKIYTRLVEFEENKQQIDPVWFRPAQVDKRLQPTRLAAASLELLKGLLYPQGSLLLFADFEPALRQLPDGDERGRFVKMLARKETLLARLRINAASDPVAIAEYWGVGGRRKDVLPLLRALHRVDGGTAINIVCLLPDFARDHLYLHSLASPGGEQVKQDCFWSAFNFFNDPIDNHFNDMAYVRQVFVRDYYEIQKPSQLGDLLLLSTKAGPVIHAAVHVAEDVVFTKNGESFTQPWILMHAEDMMDTYNVRYPLSGPLKPLYFRKKSL